jgi:hypothetical protein
MRAYSHPTLALVGSARHFDEEHDSGASAANSTANSASTNHYHVWKEDEFRAFVQGCNEVAARGECFSRTHLIVRRLARQLFGQMYPLEVGVSILHNKWTNAYKASSQQFDEIHDEALTSLVCEAHRRDWSTAAAAAAAAADPEATDIDEESEEEEEEVTADADGDTTMKRSQKAPTLAEHKRAELRMWAWVGQHMCPPRIGKLCARHWKSIQDKRTSIALQRSAERARSHDVPASSPRTTADKAPQGVAAFAAYPSSDTDMTDAVWSLAHLNMATRVVTPPPQTRSLETKTPDLSVPVVSSSSSSVIALDATVRAQIKELANAKSQGNEVFCIYRYNASHIDCVLDLIRKVFPVVSRQDLLAVHAILGSFQAQCLRIFESFWQRCRVDTIYAHQLAPLHSKSIVKWSLLIDQVNHLPVV